MEKHTEYILLAEAPSRNQPKICKCKYTKKSNRRLMRSILVLSLYNCISAFQIVSQRSQAFAATSIRYQNSIGDASRSFTLKHMSRIRYVQSKYPDITNLNQSTQTETEPESKQNSSSSLESEESLIKSENSSIIAIEEVQLATAKLSHEIALSAASNSSVEIEALETQLTSKVLNACILIVCFGFVTYTVLNVDQGMTRGWSMPEKAMRIPLDNWASYESSLNTQPVATKTLINVIIYLLGDWASQTIFVKKNVLEFDALRTIRNGVIGLVFGPLVHEYYEFSDSILPVDVGINRLYKILMDQTLYLSIKCSIYIVAVNILAGESWEHSVGMAKDKIKDVMITAWKFWPLVHCITYGAIPSRHRILWVNCVDLFWNAILALKTADNEDKEGTEGDVVSASALSDDMVAATFVKIGTENMTENLDSGSDIKLCEMESLNGRQQIEREEGSSLNCNKEQ